MATDRLAPKFQAIGREVADFNLVDLEGISRSLRGSIEGHKGEGHKGEGHKGEGHKGEGHKGEGHKAAVVVFWSGICSHCNRYDEYLNAFRDRHPDIVLLAVASRQPETPEILRRIVLERRLSFPILIDPGGVIARQWATEQTPRAFLIGPDLTVQYRGAIDNFQFAGNPDYEEYLEPAISEFLSGRPVSQPETASFGCAIQSVYYQLPKII